MNFCIWIFTYACICTHINTLYLIHWKLSSLVDEIFEIEMGITYLFQDFHAYFSTWINKYIHVYIRTFVYIYICIYTHKIIHVYIYTYIYTYVYLYMYINNNVYVDIYISIYIYTYIYIYAYIYRYINIYTLISCMYLYIYRMFGHQDICVWFIRRLHSIIHCYINKWRIQILLFFNFLLPIILDHTHIFVHDSIKLFL
jgi:hypothetical protein